MNVLSRKVRQLEENILDFPPEDEDILLYVGNEDEQLLHDRARKIRATMRDEAQGIIDSGKSPEEQNEAAKKLLNWISEGDRAILEHSSEFMRYRMERLVYKWFAVSYPKGEDERALLRVMWFFQEMQKLNHACLIENYEWNNNRNEDDPAFDDFAWWDAVNAKIRVEYPEGVFTEKSFEAFEQFHDELIANKIREYYEAHPEERAALINSLNNKMEEEKNESV